MRPPHRLCVAGRVQVQFADIFDQILAYVAGAPTNVINPDAIARRAAMGG